MEAPAGRGAVATGTRMVTTGMMTADATGMTMGVTMTTAAIAIETVSGITVETERRLRPQEGVASTTDTRRPNLLRQRSGFRNVKTLGQTASYARELNA